MKFQTTWGPDDDWGRSIAELAVILPLAMACSMARRSRGIDPTSSPSVLPLYSTGSTIVTGKYRGAITGGTKYSPRLLADGESRISRHPHGRLERRPLRRGERGNEHERLGVFLVRGDAPHQPFELEQERRDVSTAKLGGRGHVVRDQPELDRVLGHRGTNGLGPVGRQVAEIGAQACLILAEEYEKDNDGDDRPDANGEKKGEILLHASDRHFVHSPQYTTTSGRIH